MATLGWALVQVLWQGVLLAGIFALALWVCRRAPSGLRYGLGFFALVALVSLPLVSMLARGLGLALPELPVPAGVLRVTAGHLDRLAALWALGVLASGLRLLGGVWLTRRFVAESLPLPSALDTEARALAQTLGVRRVRFALSPRLESPGTVGWLDPVVLLPTCATSLLPPAELRAVLAHELAHVRRRDALANLVQSGVEALFFFHPATWWISSCVRMEREHCCDDLAARATADGRALARALARLERSAAPPALAMAGTGGLLVSRVRRLLGGVSLPWAPAGPRLRAALLCAALVGGVLAPVEPPAAPVAENGAEAEAPLVRVRVVMQRMRLPLSEPTGELPFGFDPWPSMLRVARWVLQPRGLV